MQRNISGSKKSVTSIMYVFARRGHIFVDLTVQWIDFEWATRLDRIYGVVRVRDDDVSQTPHHLPSKKSRNRLRIERNTCEAINWYVSRSAVHRRSRKRKKQNDTSERQKKKKKRRKIIKKRTKKVKIEKEKNLKRKKENQEKQEKRDSVLPSSSTSSSIRSYLCFRCPVSSWEKRFSN
ncbi:hypothetical protein PGB90_008932 [Kerria lacca]